MMIDRLVEMAEALNSTWNISVLYDCVLNA